MAHPKMIQLYKDKSLAGDSGTETFPLKRNDMILGYILKIRAKNGATRNSADAAAQATVESAVTKIEVRSGSSVFKSYTGEMCRRIATYRNGFEPEALITQKAGGTWAGNSDPSLGWHEYVFPIDFVTKQDPYGNKTGTLLPAPLYDSLDLVIDYNFTISATAGFVTGGANHVMDLYAQVMPAQDRPSMEGKRVLVEAKKHDYTSLASGDESFDLTLDSNRSLRHLYVSCYEAGIGEGVDINNLVLKVDGQYDWSAKWGDLQAENAKDCNLNFKRTYYLDAATTTDEIWTRIPSPYPSLTSGTAPTVAPYFGTLAAGDKVTVTTDAQGDVNLMEVRSPVLPATVVMDFDKDGLQQNMIYQGIKDLDLVLTNGGADAAVQIIEQSIAKPWGY